MMNHRLRGILTTMVVVSMLIFLGPSIISTAQDVLDQRVSDLETRVSHLEATVAALQPSTSAGESTLTATLEVNVVGDSWTSTGPRTCNPSSLEGVEEDAIVIVTNLDGDEVGRGVFDAGRQVNQGCAISATLNLKESEFYYITLGHWENFEFDQQYLEEHDGVIRLTSMAP